MPDLRSALQEPFALQPVHLGTSISPDYIRLLVLEVPGNNYDHIAFSDPYSLLHLAGYAGHPGYAVDASDPYAIGSKQAFNVTEYLSILFAREADPCYYGPFFLPSTTSIIQLITSNNNYGPQINGIIGAVLTSLRMQTRTTKAFFCAIALKNDS